MDGVALDQDRAKGSNSIHTGSKGSQDGSAWWLKSVRDRPERSLLSQFLRRFRNPLVLILIAASVVSAFTGEVASFVIIIVMVLLSVTLDFVQEYRAGRAAQRLRQSVQLRASVLRDGVAKDVPVTQVVPGDVVLLAAGSPCALPTDACSRRAICM